MTKEELKIRARQYRMYARQSTARALGWISAARFERLRGRDAAANESIAYAAEARESASMYRSAALDCEREAERPLPEVAA